MKRVVMGISGASGVDFALEFAEFLSARCELILVASKGAKRALKAEAAAQTAAAADTAAHTAAAADTAAQTAAAAGRKALKYRSFKDFKRRNKSIKVLKNSDLAAAIASGSYPVDAYFFYASASTACAAAAGLANNLLLRALFVGLKERRRVIIAPREMPMPRALLRALCELEAAGAMIAAPLIASYGGCEIKEFLFGRYAQLLGLKDLGNFSIWDEKSPQSQPKTKKFAKNF